MGGWCSGSLLALHPRQSRFEFHKGHEFCLSVKSASSLTLCGNVCGATVVFRMRRKTEVPSTPTSQDVPCTPKRVWGADWKGIQALKTVCTIKVESCPTTGHGLQTLDPVNCGIIIECINKGKKYTCIYIYIYIYIYI